MRIARALPGDAATLTRIAYEAKRRWGYPEGWIERWADVLTLTADYIRSNPTYCAFVGEEIAGFGALRLNGAEAILDHVWVATAHAGQGIGRSLFRRCEVAAKEAGASVLTVESDPHAEGFYRAMGARTVGRQPAPMDGVERFLPLMKKELTP
jgi:GNAT superfamily N-acetyltransferase